MMMLDIHRKKPKREKKEKIVVIVISSVGLLLLLSCAARFDMTMDCKQNRLGGASHAGR